MTGPEHYREAERLLEMAEHPRRVVMGLDPDKVSDEALDVLRENNIGMVLPEGTSIHDATAALAQVHATLALAAATFTGSGAGLPADSDTARDWREVIL